MSLKKLQQELQSLSNKEYAKVYQRFFKTKKGAYGQGDVFLGIRVPVQRSVAKKYNYLKLEDIKQLLQSNIHEYRFTGLVILIHQFKKADEKEQTKITMFYIKHANLVNNWDLVDISASHILGEYLLDKDKSILYNMCKSKNLWEKRISIVATHAFIKNNDFKHTIKISKLFLKEKHDLIHKAVGWMLRETGKKNEKVLTTFLDTYSKVMPRTMLRYSIERLSQKQKKKYMLQ